MDTTVNIIWWHNSPKEFPLAEMTLKSYLKSLQQFFNKTGFPAGKSEHFIVHVYLMLQAKLTL